jgi:formate dehydrogenase iron-sulfur subunit
MKALVTERVGKGVAWMPFHFGGWLAGRDLRGNYPKGTDPIVLGESANTITTYGYDPATNMQETKVTLCQIAAASGATTMARMKFLCDADRCIECNACVTACKNEHEVPWGINRRRVVTINDGKPGERSVSMACMHCTDAPCAAVCPVNCFYTTADGVVLHSKDLCIGCGYCFYACPFGAPQYPKVGNFGSRGKMDKCTFCAGGPEADGSREEYEKYGANRLAEGKLPLCAEMCSTKSLLAGDGEIIAQIYKERVMKRGYGSGAWGWKTAYHETIGS